MQKKRRIGIMGGTFNPIHNGHLEIGRQALDQYLLDEVVFMPAGLQWMKKDSPDWMDAEVRYEMTSLAVEGMPHFSVSRMEIDRPGNTYTYETLQILHEKEPESELFYLIGADTLSNMPSWRNPQLVFSQCVILCALRDDTDSTEFERLVEKTKKQFADADIRPLSMLRMDISSSEIRRRIEQGLDVAEMLPEKVMEYIYEHDLYR